jgi:hypothetical protein
VLKFEALKPLFSFLNVPMMLRNHWNDSIGWVMAKCMHQHVIKKVKEVIVSLKYLAISCDKVTMIDNQSWVSICCCRLVPSTYVNVFRVGYGMRGFR